MSEQSPELLTSALANFVNQSTAILNTTTDLVNTQIPVLFEQLIMFEVTFSSVALAVSITVLAALAYVITKYYKQLDVQMVPLGVASTLALIAVIINFYNVMLVTLAPKVFLLEYIRNFI